MAQKTITLANLSDIDPMLIASDDATPTGEVDFTSRDTELSPSASESVELLTASDSWSARLFKISQVFKNVRYLLKMLGTTDISSIGSGTVTSAISELNGNLTRVDKIRHYYTSLGTNEGTQESRLNLVIARSDFPLNEAVIGSFLSGSYHFICGFLDSNKNGGMVCINYAGGGVFRVANGVATKI